MAGGQVVWQDDNKQPTMTVDEARRTFRDVVLGLEYRASSHLKPLRAGEN